MSYHKALIQKSFAGLSDTEVVVQGIRAGWALGSMVKSSINTGTELGLGKRTALRPGIKTELRLSVRFLGLLP